MFAVVIFCMPVTIPVTASSMNYASVVFCTFAVISAAWYFAYARTHFKGPGSLDGRQLPIISGEDPGCEKLSHSVSVPAKSDGENPVSNDSLPSSTSSSK